MKIEELQKVIQELPLNRRMKPNLLGTEKRQCRQTVRFDQKRENIF
jgi:hypothetical protein